MIDLIDIIQDANEENIYHFDYVNIRKIAQQHLKTAIVPTSNLIDHVM